MIVAAAGAIAGGISVIGSAVSGIGGAIGDILGINPNKDPMRLAANAQAFTAARSGDTTAVKFLLNRSGRAGPGPFPADAWSMTTGTATQYGPWATQLAKDDAFAKYQSAAGSVAVPGSLPSPPGALPSVPPVPGAGAAPSGLPSWAIPAALAAGAAFLLFRR